MDMMKEIFDLFETMITGIGIAIGLWFIIEVMCI